ncbi:interleukin-17 receptor E-like protein [Cebidichthys violaceus]|uniref:interleukin-17 receptor E-like protein n=1 Tax=Cebidichthys violaceus TaxID=271503 RepID=UPI0035C97129
MRWRRFGTALAFVAVAVSPLLLACSMECHMKEAGGGKRDDVCPVELTSVLTPASSGIYSECVTVRVWMKAGDFCKAPKIEILSTSELTGGLQIISPILKKKERSRIQCHRRKEGETVKCTRGVTQRASSALWELVHTCVEAEANAVVSASFNTTSRSCSVSYTVPDPVPVFDVSVNRSSKSISVTVEAGDKVHTRWCYRKYGKACIAEDSSPTTVDPSQSRVALLSIPYLLPCVCVEVYYARTDSGRDVKCPLLNESLSDVRDVWLSSELTLHEWSLTWSSLCSASDLKISASLCWRQHEHLCIPALNSTLEDTDDGPDLIYNTSAVDRHPHMCVQFSLQGSHHISCPFYADMSSWEVRIGPGSQSVCLYLTSSVPAKFSAQLCVLDQRGCRPVGPVHSVTMGRSSAETTLNVPLHVVAEKPCVQVWQSDPALHGRRVLCPDYTHYRCGMYAVAALVFVVLVALLGAVIQRLTKRGAAGWLSIQEPVLLVCSSEQSAHISAVGSLASILQGELSAKVHMALWAQSSKEQTGTGVADLGPLPWLYGQWEAVREARGKVLIVWSPEATKTYVRWREERANMDKKERKEEDYSRAEVRREKIRVEVEEDFNFNGRRQCKKEKAAGCVKFCEDKDWDVQREPSAVIAPVFTAALACLEGALQEGKGQGVGLVYFQGLGHRRDIPKTFRGVPRYCLPQDFRALIQELGGMRRQTEAGKSRWRCWPRLLSKVLSMWLAQKLTHRLQTLLPQTPGKKTRGPGVTAPPPGRTRSRLKLPPPPAANSARPGTAKEREPLRAEDP